MSDQIPTHYAQQYAHNIKLLLQQKGSRLRPYVTDFPISGAKAAVPWDQIGKVEATKRTTRYPPLAPNDTPADRPWVYPSDYDWPDLIDSIDKLRTLVDPTSTYAQNGTFAMGRAQDREILAAFFANRNTGETGATSTAFPAGNQIAVNFGAAGNVGLTVAKMREVKRLLLAAEVDEDDPLTIAVTATQHDNLLGEIQVISLDFNEKPVMMEGKVVRFLGLNVVHTELLVNDVNAFRRCPAWAKSGMVLGMWNDITTDISIRRDLAGLPTQVYVYGTFGATRTEEAKVYEVKCA
jgi:hypothetical protein